MVNLDSIYILKLYIIIILWALSHSKNWYYTYIILSRSLGTISNLNIYKKSLLLQKSHSILFINPYLFQLVYIEDKVFLCNLIWLNPTSNATFHFICSMISEVYSIIILFVNLIFYDILILIILNNLSLRIFAM